MVSYLQIEGLAKRFGATLMYQNVSMELSEGQRVAIVAKNGAGKTTLLNIIAGKEPYDEGLITFKNDLRIAYLDQNPTYPAHYTVLEAFCSVPNEMANLIARYEALLAKGDEVYQTEEFQQVLTQMDLHKAWEYEQRAKQILSKLNITDFSQKVGTLSGGQLKRMALANALISEPDLLILDEPTNHLDLAMTEWLEEYLNKSSLTLLMVTHDRYFLDRVCTEIIEIDNKQLYRYKGNYSYYLEKHQERNEQRNAELARANNLFRKELDWMRRQPQARGTKAKSRIDDFYTLQEKVRQKPTQGQVRLEVKSAYLGSKIFEAQYICKSFGPKRILHNFYYQFSKGEKMGIVGANGTGKSTFVKLLLGIEKPDSGAFDIGETVKFGYYSQEGLQFNEQMKVIDVVRDIAEEIDLGGGKKLSASQFLTHFLFSPETQNNYVYKLSGGEKRRLHLCTVLMKNPNFLVLDEPTNDLDIVTLNLLEEYLQGFAGCVIVVSHDRYFMDKVVDHLLVFKGDAQVQDFPGNYTDYRYWRIENEKQKTQEKKKETPQVVAPKTDKKRKLTYAEQQEFKQLEKDIAALEAEKAALEEAFASGNLSAEQLQVKAARMNELLPLLDEKEMRWLELSEV
ncbi:MAG: ABC-F family ATP-binding cassette domain-containing protein [Paludibacteraceae bacterium]|nr:ABC-F family ATP-binding cassette domain-containing protein [Paludibacteraceae bacterium]